ncbi:hypothetical protein EJB05_39151, partial [Eragrostis curvula]
MELKPAVLAVAVLCLALPRAALSQKRAPAPVVETPAPAPAPHYVNLTDLLSLAGPYGTFLSYLIKTDVIKTLQSQANNTDVGVTIFAPEDSAFAAVDRAALANLTADQLRTLMLCHALPAYHPLSSFAALARTNPVPTFAGGQCTVNVTYDAGRIRVVSSWGKAARLVSSVYSTPPAAVYALDKVLLPEQVFPTEPVVAPSAAPAPSPAEAAKHGGNAYRRRRAGRGEGWWQELGVPGRCRARCPRWLIGSGGFRVSDDVGGEFFAFCVALVRSLCCCRNGTRTSRCTRSINMTLLAYVSALEMRPFEVDTVLHPPNHWKKIGNDDESPLLAPKPHLRVCLSGVESPKSTATRSSSRNRSPSASPTPRSSTPACNMRRAVALFTAVIVSASVPHAGAHRALGKLPLAPDPARPMRANLTEILTLDGPFGTFLTYLQQTDLVEVFQRQAYRTDQGVTILVPVDRAFAAVQPSVLPGLSRHHLRDLMLYHSLARRYELAEFEELSRSNPVTTLAGRPYTVNVTCDAGTVRVRSRWAEAKIVGSVSVAAPMAVYELDRVLLPDSLFPAQPPVVAAAPAPAPSNDGAAGAPQLGSSDPLMPWQYASAHAGMADAQGSACRPGADQYARYAAATAFGALTLVAL